MGRWVVVIGLALGLFAQPVPTRAQVACGTPATSGQVTGSVGYVASGAGADCGATTTSGNTSLLAVLQALASLYGPTPQFDPYANALAVSGLSAALSRGTTTAATYAGSPTSWSGSPTASAPPAMTGAPAPAAGSVASGPSGALPASGAGGNSGSAPGSLTIPPTGLSFQGSPLAWSGSPLTGTPSSASASASPTPAPARPNTLAVGSAGPNAVSAAVAASANLYNYPGSPIVYAPGTSPTAGGSPPVGSAVSAVDPAPSGAPPVGALPGATSASAPSTGASAGPAAVGGTAGGASPYGLLIWPGSTPSTPAASASAPSTGASAGPAAPAASTLLPVVASPLGYLPLTFQVAQALFYGAAPTSNPQMPATMLVWGTSGAAAAGSPGAANR
jgi:S-DNA-T family DNA segregation ATPase FtsK/SpoIIIE